MFVTDTTIYIAPSNLLGQQIAMDVKAVKMLLGGSKSHDWHSLSRS